MSGCVHCVYDLYATSLAEYATALASARSALEAKRVPRAEWPGALLQGGRSDQGGEVEGVKEDMVDVLEGMDPGMRAFLELEGRLGKAKKVANGQDQVTL